jgi:hypothetical protein
MIYTNKPYTNAIHGGPTDATMKYLNIEKMFMERKTVFDYYSLSKKAISQCFDINLFKENIK